MLIPLFFVLGESFVYHTNALKYRIGNASSQLVCPCRSTTWSSMLQFAFFVEKFFVLCPRYGIKSMWMKVIVFLRFRIEQSLSTVLLGISPELWRCFWVTSFREIQWCFTRHRPPIWWGYSLWLEYTRYFSGPSFSNACSRYLWGLVCSNSAFHKCCTGWSNCLGEPQCLRFFHG